MRTCRVAAAVMVAVGFVGGPSPVGEAWAQVPRTLQEFGAPVYPAFEGWYRNPDGTSMLLIGFYNSNQSQVVALPIGELNYFSPGVADRGQPSHFPPGRSWGVFTVQVPGDFDGELSWTLVANNQPVTVPFHLRASYYIEPFKDASNHNEPPTIKFAADGPELVGPAVGVAHTATTQIGRPVEISLWLSDVTPDIHVRENPFRRNPPMALHWQKLRGPGAIEMVEPEQEFDGTDERLVATTFTFDAAGDYWLRAEALDATGHGGSGFQCCWTSAIVHVTVSP